MAFYIGVDVGGTTTTVSLGDEARRVLQVSPQFATQSSEGPRAVIEAVVREIVGLLEQAGLALSQVRAVGLATPGPATIDGVLLKTPNLDPTLWDRFPIRHALQQALQELGTEVVVEYIGDGQAAALGEYALRTGAISWERVPAGGLPDPSIASLFMVTVGTGLGGGGVFGGQPVRGSQGRAGHVGHLTLPRHAFRYEHDRQLRVGNAYCTAESAVSLTSLAHQLQHRLTLDRWQSHPLHAVAGSMRDKAKRLRDLVAAQDELALELFDDQARALGITLLNVNYLGDYDLLVIGGGICDLTAELRERYLLRCQEAYHAHALDGFRNLEGPEFSRCGDDASVLGALAWAYPRFTAA